jgi:type IX secretion system PorP/SprF family membrane protein
MKKILVIFLLCSVGKVSAQDFHLSMYDAAPLFLNPSMTGVFEADYRIHGQYRTQWKSVNFKPYTSALISFDMPVGKWGFGAQIQNFRAGIGNFNALQGLFSTSYYVPINKKKTHILNFGLQGGVTQKSVEYQLLSFNNQYTTAGGGAFDQTLVSGENFAGQRTLVPNLNGGIMYYNAGERKRINLFGGVSVFNLLTPRETFFGKPNDLPLRMYTHIGARINITELLYLVPKVLSMNQLKFQEQTFALELGYFMKSSETYLLAGGIFRNKDAAIVHVGARKDAFILKVGYDFNLSTLSLASSGRGGFEIAFTYLYKKAKPSTYKICPRL